MPEEPTYTIADLARLTSLNVRTIRYYLAQGLIPASGESGPGAHYGQGHLDRLRLTKRLQQQHLPLAEIRQRLAALEDSEVAGLLGTTPKPDAPATSALDYVRNVLGSAAGSAPAPPALSAMPASVVAQQARSKPGDPRRGRMLLREATSPSSRVVSLPEVLPGASGMPRMKDVPAIDPRLTAAEAKAAYAARAGQANVAGSTSTESQPPERSQWERHSLGPNIELHVRRPMSRLEQRRVERLITIARQVLKEDGV